MIRDIFATKIGMTQAWTTKGKRVPVTKCRVDDNIVLSHKTVQVLDSSKTQRLHRDAALLEIGYGTKKMKNMAKPLRSQLEKSGFSVGVQRVRGIHVDSHEEVPAVGKTVDVVSVLEVGDVVQVRGTSKGVGFAGAMKRHNFRGGPKTHGQSDRARAVGSIGQGTTPGRVFKGKKMPGRAGNEIVAVTGLVVLHVDADQKEVWLSGPIPGSLKSIVRIQKTDKKKNITLQRKASGLPEEKPVEDSAEESNE